MAVSTDYNFQQATSAGGTGRAAAMAGGNFDTFLKMLTTQITNQDPLNPMEGSDFAVQLATFSGVEQQARTNQLIEVLGTKLGLSGLSQMAGWIGKEARSAAPAWFADQPLTLELKPDSSADQAVLVTRDSHGRIVGSEQIGLGVGQADWFGRDAAGAKLPDGAYSFALESWRDGTLIATNPVETYARVTETRLVDGEAILVLAGGAEVPATQVRALRDPVM